MHSVVFRLLHTCFRFLAVSKVRKPRWGHPLVEFVIVGMKVRFIKDRSLETSCMLVHSDGALKGRPREVRSVQPLFRLPRGSTQCSVRERVEFLKLACLYLGSGTVYYRAT